MHARASEPAVLLRGRVGWVGRVDWEGRSTVAFKVSQPKGLDSSGLSTVVVFSEEMVWYGHGDGGGLGGEGAEREGRGRRGGERDDDDGLLLLIDWELGVGSWRLGWAGLEYTGGDIAGALVGERGEEAMM